MSAKPFEPKGEVARWVPVFENLRDLEPGVVVTYEQLSEWAGVDVRFDRSPVVQADKKLLELHQKGITNVTSVGYRIMHASEHSSRARSYNQKANGAIKRAIRVLENTDSNALTPQQREGNEAMLGALAAQRDMNRRTTSRQNRMEAALQEARQESRAARRETKATTAELEEKVAKQGETLARLQKVLLDREESPAT